MNALVCMQAEKRRLHAVPSCGSDRLKRHFREGSVAGISPLYAGGRPVLRNICKIAKFVDTAENDLKEAFLV